MDNKHEEEKGLVYTPSSIIDIFDSSISIGVEKKIIQIEGIYKRKATRDYNNKFYDRIIDPLNENNNLSLLIPKKIRDSLIEDYSYKFIGYVKRKVTNNGYIQIDFCVTAVIKDSEKANFENEDTAISIVKRKALKDFKNFKLSVENKLLSGYKPSFALILGENAVIKSDIINALDDDSIKFSYSITEHRVNLSARQAIIDKINNIDESKEYDAVIIARGGGTGLEIFNDKDIIECLSDIETILVTAIGHAVDFTFLQAVADCSFDTPTALGNYLKEVSQKVIDMHYKENKEIAKLNSQISTLAERNEKYDKDLNMLRVDIGKKDTVIGNLNEQLKDRSTEFKTLKKSQYIKLGIAVAIIIIIFLFK